MPAPKPAPRPGAHEGPDARPHLFGLLPQEIEARLAEAGTLLREGEARRLMSHVVARGRDDLELARPLSRRVLAAVEQHLDLSPLEVVERAEDEADGFVKYLFRAPDGVLFEAVRIPLHLPGRFSACLSSQAGCAMGCDFCATGRMGLVRDLQAWEMVAAFRALRNEAPGRLSGAVFMGQGEPLANYEQVVRAASILSHPCGGRISAPAISISTVGLVPQVRRFTREGHKFRLIFSLTSALPERRRRLLPVAGEQDLDSLIEAIHEYGRSTRARVTIAWVLLGGVNHDQAEIDALQRAFRGLPIRLNLIDVNDPREGGYRRATCEEMNRFLDDLQVLGVPIVRRYSGGASKDAACGMLASKRVGMEPQAE
ncbi:MAG: 23S rRNA (adenine(2503)-C(2))-methyltransferase RlmN [Myxococcota bacterium]